MAEKTAAKPVEMVTFKFRNLDDAFIDPKTKRKFDLEFICGDERYKFVDGKVHTAPREVVEHLNSVAYPVYGEQKDEDGNTVCVKIGEINRFECFEISSDKAA